MDQLSAHLDRGWDLAEQGDALGAGASVRKAIELAPDSPEAYNLLGFVNALDGDSDEAIEAYQHAALLDETYVEAMLNAAELLLHPVGDPEGALVMCNQALAVAHSPEELLEVRLLKLEAELLNGNRDDARRLLEAVLSKPLENPLHNFLAARAMMELGDHKRAAPLLEGAIEQDPNNPEVHYFQGMLFEHEDDPRAACGAFLRTRQLDLEIGLPPWAPNAESFLMFAQGAVAQLPKNVHLLADGADIFISDVPGCEAVVSGVNPRSMVMIDMAFHSLEAAQRATTIEPEHVSTRIFIYVLNVMRGAAGLHNVQQAIADALTDELNNAVEDLGAMASETLGVSIKTSDKTSE